MSGDDKKAIIAKVAKAYDDYLYRELVLDASLRALQGILANPNEHPEFRNPGETCEQANARLALLQGKAFADAFSNFKR